MGSTSYLTVYFSSEGAIPSDVVEALKGMGFEPATGNFDFIYAWSNTIGVLEAVDFADQVYHTLKGMNVRFKLETV